MPAMPPTSAVPLLSTFRRGTVVMHSSLVMPLGRSDAGLESLSAYRASVVQRMRTFSRAQHVVSAIICWCFRASRVSGEFRARQGEFFAEQALQPGHDPYRHTGTLPRSTGVAVAERVFPVLWKAWYRNAGATSLSPVAAGNQALPLVRRPLSHFANWPPSTISTEPVTWDASTEAGHRIGSAPFRASVRRPSRHIFAPRRSRSSRVCPEERRVLSSRLSIRQEPLSKVVFQNAFRPKQLILVGLQI